MTTKYINLKGSLKWAKVYEPDEAFGQKNWKICFYPADDKEWEKFNKTGLQLKRQEDTDGEYVTFRRPTSKVIKDDLVMFSPPEITGEVNVSYKDQDGNRIRQYNKGDKVTVTRDGEPVNIGNGTEAIVNLSYYQTAKGPGHRLESIRILSLVEYYPSDFPTDTPKKEEPKKEEKKSEDKKKELNDDIPW